jgi:tetratricopeptide (TPR) repeat protein
MSVFGHGSTALHRRRSAARGAAFRRGGFPVAGRATVGIALVGVAFVLGGGVGVASAAPEADVATRFDKANEAFAAGRAPEAVRGYRAILQSDGVSAPLLFNLANAELRAGEIGPAVLDYERALALAPRDRDVQANLRQARRSANLALPEPGPVDQAVARLSADEWAHVASVALALACLAAVAVALARRGREPSPGLLRAARVGLVLGIAGCALGASASYAALRRLERGVVLGNEPALRLAPYPAATTSGRVKSGEVVAIERLHQEYALVRTEDGRSGWVASNDVGRIGDGLTAIVPTP